jgi:hypothetical protein
LIEGLFVPGHGPRCQNCFGLDIFHGFHYSPHFFPFQFSTTCISFDVICAQLVGIKLLPSDFLRMIPTNRHSIWHTFDISFFWSSICRTIWHFIWHAFWPMMWHVFWPSTWHNLSPFLTYMLTFYLTFFLAFLLTFLFEILVLSDILSDLLSDICFNHPPGPDFEIGGGAGLILQLFFGVISFWYS